MMGTVHASPTKALALATLATTPAGAPHCRPRLWIVGDDVLERLRRRGLEYVSPFRFLQDASFASSA